MKGWGVQICYEWVAVGGEFGIESIVISFGLFINRFDIEVVVESLQEKRETTQF